MSEGARTPIVISDTAYPVRVLGPGRRFVVWTQGCTLACRGCMAVHTWAPAQGRRMTVGVLLDAIADRLGQGVDGITVTGGEPTQQPEALKDLLTRLRGLPGAGQRDVLVYTGRELDWCLREGASLFDGADAVMTGPYNRDLAGSLPLRGSDNQVLWLRTSLGVERFAPERLPRRDGLELHHRPGAILLVGIPGPGDLTAVHTAAMGSGMRATGRSTG